MSIRLTAENLTTENLSKAAVEHAGLLGMYQKSEFDKMMNVSLEDWSFDWLPSNLDVNAGRVKMRPLTQDAVKMLDRGRALRISERHSHLGLPRCIALIKALKRHRLGMHGDVQDALIVCWNKPGVDEAMEDKSAFHRWVKKHSKAGLRPEHREAVFDLIPKITRVMRKEIKQRRRPQGNPKANASA